MMALLVIVVLGAGGAVAYLQLSGAVKELSPAELLKLAEERRVELEEAGEIDRLGDVMPEKPPELNAAIVGTELEICWRYWRTPTAEEVAGGEKRKKIGVPIWCTGTVCDAPRQRHDDDNQS